jgi:hypothetical protein
VRNLRLAYNFVKQTAFYDIPLPRRVTIVRKPLKKAWGYYYDNRIEIDAGILTGTKLLKVMAHEMIHAALHGAGACDTSDHGEKFQIVADIVCERMGWSKRGF